MTIAMPTIPNDARVPLFYGEVDNSMANSGAQTLRRLLIAQVNDDVDLPVSALTLVSRTSEATALGGDGSMLSAMYAKWRQIDQMGEIWVVPVKVGVGEVAKGTIKFTGAATEAGLVSAYVGSTRVNVAVAIGQTAAETATALSGAVNAAFGLPVTATVADATVTLACRWKGETGNDVRLSVNQQGAAANERTPAGLVVEITQPTGGAGAPDIVSTLALVGDEPFEFIGHPYTDVTTLDGLKDWMSGAIGRWSYTQQLYGHVYSARRGTMGELVPFGRARNDEHISIEGFEPGSPDPVWLWAASFAARTAVFTSADVGRPTQTGEQNGIKPAPAGQRFILNERQSLLTNGIATQTYEGGSVRIERAITTYQRNAYGQPDDSYLDSETMHQIGYSMRRLRSVVTSKFGRYKLADDGTNFGDGAAIVTPKTIRAEMIAVYREMERDGVVENADLFAKYLIVERDANNPNRVNVLFPPDYVNQLRIFALVNRFRLQYPEAA